MMGRKQTTYEKSFIWSKSDEARVQVTIRFLRCNLKQKTKHVKVQKIKQGNRKGERGLSAMIHMSETKPNDEYYHFSKSLWVRTRWIFSEASCTRIFPSLVHVLLILPFLFKLRAWNARLALYLVRSSLMRTLNLSWISFLRAITFNLSR